MSSESLEEVPSGRGQLNPRRGHCSQAPPLGQPNWRPEGERQRAEEPGRHGDRSWKPLRSRLDPADRPTANADRQSKRAGLRPALRFIRLLARLLRLVGVDLGEELVGHGGNLALAVALGAVGLGGNDQAGGLGGGHILHDGHLVVIAARSVAGFAVDLGLAAACLEAAQESYWTLWHILHFSAPTAVAPRWPT